MFVADDHFLLSWTKYTFLLLVLLWQCLLMVKDVISNTRLYAK